MEIIPVIDLMHGQAVHARQGRREAYRPLQSPLCRSAEPVAVLERLLSLHPFRTVYVADLDALMGRGRQAEALASLRRAFPEIRFWIDQGLPDPDARDAGPPAVTVIGSESLSDGTLARLAEIETPFVLSLDCRDGQLLGPAALPERPDLWPETVILMSLSHVGGTAGPDVARAERFRSRHPERRCVAAGGVRGAADLERLRALGLAGVLVASALHSGAVDARVLARFG